MNLQKLEHARCIYYIGSRWPISPLSGPKYLEVIHQTLRKTNRKNSADSQRGASGFLIKFRRQLSVFLRKKIGLTADHKIIINSGRVRAHNIVSHIKYSYD